MNETQEYHDRTTGKTVIGSNQYNHLYSNGQGELIYSDPPGLQLERYAQRRLVGIAAGETSIALSGLNKAGIVTRAGESQFQS